MIWLLWVSLGSLALFGVSLLSKFDFPIFVAGCLCILTLFVSGIITVIVLPSRSVGRATCHRWGEQTGYTTKFVILNWSDTGTCLALTSNGRWVQNTQVIINVPERP